MKEDLDAALKLISSEELSDDDLAYEIRRQETRLGLVTFDTRPLTALRTEQSRRRNGGDHP